MNKLLYFSLTPLLLSMLGTVQAEDWDLRKPVRIETGLIEGVTEAGGEVVVFKGIPYAAAPVGNLRWREPQPAGKWEGVRKADAYGASCVQPTGSGVLPWSVFGRRVSQCSEDCLYLNVWTPAKSASERLPILFYIHGGSDTTGSGSGNIIDGEALARKGIIVVTINYRLGIYAGMGHPQLTAESPHHVCANYGMLDMIAALKWVQHNIGDFGGDASKVTIAGQSSGAHSVHYLTTSPLAKGLFRGAIAVSFPIEYLLKPKFIACFQLKEEAGLKFAEAKKAKSIDDLRKIPALDLMADDPAVEINVRGRLGGGVTRDGWAFPMDYVDAIEKGLESDVPTMAGFTADDFGPVARYSKTTAASFSKNVPKMFERKKDAYLALYPARTDQEAKEMEKLSQIEYRMSSIFYWAKKRAETAKTPVFTYIFEHAMPWTEHPEFGAFHGSDLVYEFNNLKKLDRPWTEADGKVAELVSSYWVNFVKTGNPNGENLPKWAAFKADDLSTMALGVQSGPRAIAGKERVGFYQELLEKRETP